MCGLRSIFVGYLVCRSLEDILIGEVDGSDGYDSEKDSCRPSKLSEDLQLKKVQDWIDSDCESNQAEL